MSERYWITGVQLGLLTNAEAEDRAKILKEIEDKQFIGNYPTDKDKRLFMKWVEDAPMADAGRGA